MSEFISEDALLSPHAIVQMRVFKQSIPWIVVRIGKLALDDWHLTPVFAPGGQIALYDIFIKDQWVGSKRTEKQCHEVIRNAALLA